MGLSFPDLGEAPYDGSTPVIVYDAACGVPLAPNHSISGMARSGGGGRVSGARAPIEDDVDRLEVARPSDPSDPYLRSWTKTLPGQATLSSPFFPSLPFLPSSGDRVGCTVAPSHELHRHRHCDGCGLMVVLSPRDGVCNSADMRVN